MSIRPTISIVFNKRRKLKKGAYPFKFRAKYNRQADYISLKFYMNEAEYEEYTT